MTTLTAPQIAYVAAQAGFTGHDLAIAVAVALGESGGRTDNVGQNSDDNATCHHSKDLGLWQINDCWNKDVLGMGDWRNPYDNARMAYKIRTKHGWNDWVVYKTGIYLGHMPVALVAAKSPTAPAGSEPSSADASNASLAGLAGPLGQITALLKMLSDGTVWKRVGFTLAGVVLTVIGLSMAVGGTSVGKAIGKSAKTAVKVAVL